MYLDILKKMQRDQAEHERQLVFRHSWFPYVYNWIIAITLVALVIGFAQWGFEIKARNRAEAEAAIAMAQYQQEQREREEAEARELAAAQALKEAQIEAEAMIVSKAFYGIRNFITKYNYTDKDLDTYSRCMFNRVDFGNKVNSLEAIVSQKDQFLGYAENNPVMKEYYDVALKLVKTWHEETIKPCDLTYRWAELENSGIYLINEFNADGYARRWQA